jgi:hypothetical protein
MPQLLELVCTGVIAPSTVPTQVGDAPSVLDANDLRAAADRLDQGRSRHPSRHPGRPTPTPRGDLVSDSVTPQEVLGQLVDEKALVAAGEAHGASMDLVRPARDPSRGRPPQR